MAGTVARAAWRAYLACMSEPSSFHAPAFLDSDRPAVPDLVVARGVVPFYLRDRPVRGRLVRLGVEFFAVDQPGDPEFVPWLGIA